MIFIFPENRDRPRIASGAGFVGIMLGEDKGVAGGTADYA
jgi:hypothetical protein